IGARGLAERAGGEESSKIHLSRRGQVDTRATCARTQIQFGGITVSTQTLAGVAFDLNLVGPVQHVAHQSLVELALLGALGVKHQIDAYGLHASSVTPVDPVTGSKYRNRVTVRAIT